MPAAGSNPASRRSAHLRWSARYNEAGDVHKATAHFGRAVHYAGFGGPSATKAFMESLYAPGASKTAESVTSALYARDALRDTSDKNRDTLLQTEREVDDLYSRLRGVVDALIEDRMDVESSEEDALGREIAEIKERMSEYKKIPVFPIGADSAQQRAKRKAALLSLKELLSQRIEALDTEKSATSEKRRRSDADTVDLDNKLSRMSL
jgi:hypothetical protein